ncbi:MAG TPA: TonB-dependent receptor, partial [Thermoanaerobaculia bacterium]
MRPIRTLLFALFSLLPVVVFAQGFQTGTIAGIATDQTGGALPGVTVTVTHQERATSRSEITDAQGRYRFAALPLGRYTVDGALDGFDKSSKSNVLVEAEKTTELNLLLGLAASIESITVTAVAPVVDPTRVTQTTRLSTQEYEKAPIGRSYQTITTYAPGVLDADGDGNANVNGAISSSNQYIFDGVDTTDPTTGTFSANLNFEAIQEVNVYTSGISAEYGRSTGAVINVITKSGTNDFEGSFKVIGTNDEWDAQNRTRNTITGASLAREKVDHDNIRYSATLGGPIVQNRAWFFGAYEKFKPLGSRTNTAVTNEEYSQNPEITLQNYRATFQLTPSHNLWVKYAEDPILGG